MGGNKKKWFFHFFFFRSKKSKNLQFSPHEIHFLVVFWTKKKTTLFMTSGQKKSQSAEMLKSEKLSNPKISVLHWKNPKKYFLGTGFFQKNCQILKSWFFKSTHFWVIFRLFFHCQHRGISKTSKNGHFLIKSAYSCMQFSIFGTTFCRSVGR